MLNRENRVNYISEKTKVSSKNLNNIQDSVLDNSERVVNLEANMYQVNSQLATKAEKSVVTNLSNRFEEVISNVTNGNEGVTNSEIVAARDGYTSLGDRLNSISDKLDSNVLETKVMRSVDYSTDPISIQSGNTCSLTHDNAYFDVSINHVVDPNHSYVYLRFKDSVNDILNKKTKFSVVVRPVNDMRVGMALSRTTNWSTGLCSVRDLTLKGNEDNIIEFDLSSEDVVKYFSSNAGIGVFFLIILRGYCGTCGVGQYNFSGYIKETNTGEEPKVFSDISFMSLDSKKAEIADDLNPEKVSEIIDTSVLEATKVVDNFIIQENYISIGYSKTMGEFTTQSMVYEDGYYNMEAGITDVGAFAACMSLGVKDTDIKEVKVYYEFLEPTTHGAFIGLGKSFYWGNMKRVDCNRIGSGVITFLPDQMPNYGNGSTLQLMIGSSSGTHAKCKFRFEILKNTDKRLYANISDGLTQESMNKIKEASSEFAFNNIVSNMYKVPVGVKTSLFSEYLVRNNTNSLVKLTDLGSGIINVKKESTDVGTNYQGVYVKIPYDSLEDLDGDFMVEYKNNGGQATPHQFCLLYDVTDWGAGNSQGVIYYTPNTIFNLKEKLEKSSLKYNERNYLYVVAVKYSASGVSETCDWNIRVKLSKKNQAPVVANDLTSSLKETLIEEIKQGKQSYITCWGDSLTAGGGWTSTLQNLTGLTVYNGGTGGENSACIMARQGGDVMTINNITIPSDLTPITIATRSGDGGISTYFGKKVSPLLQGGSHVNPCYIGDIKGTLKWTGSNYADTTGTWTFTRSEVGEEIVINRPTAIRTDFDINKNAPKVMIIFIGQNGGYDSIEHLIRQHRYMIEHSNCEDFIVLGLSSGTASQRSGYEEAMKNEFGRRFISLREYLSQYGLDDAGIEPTEQDIAMMEQGQTPQSLLSDTVHYNSACKTVIGNMIYKRIKELNMI